MQIIAKLSQVHSNPYHSGVLDPERVKRHEDSIRTHGQHTAFAARARKDGEFEIAFGHHRCQAMRNLGLTEVQLDVKDRSNTEMLRLMVSENDPEFNHKGSREAVDTVRAAVSALACGDLPEAEEKSTSNYLRFAPSYTVGRRTANGKPYTALSLARALGRTTKAGKADTSIEAGLAYLEAVESGALELSPAAKDKLIGDRSKTSHLASSLLTLEQVESATDLLRQVKRLVELHKARMARVHAQRRELALHNEEMQQLIAERKERERKEEAEHDRQLEELASARRAENVQKALALREEIKRKEGEAEKKRVLDSIRISEVEEKIAEAKKKAEATNEEELQKLRANMLFEEMKGKLARVHEPLMELAKAVQRNKHMSLFQRNTLRKAALDAALVMSQDVAKLFLAPLSPDRQRKDKKQ